MLTTWKRSILLCSALALMLLIGVPAQADNHGDDDDVIVEVEPTNKDLVKVTHIFRRGKAGAGGKGGGGSADYKLLSYKWPDNSTVNYTFYTNNVADAEITATANHVQDGFVAWSAVNSKAPKTHYTIGTATAEVLQAVGTFNTTNEMCFKDLGATTTIAVTTTWYQRGARGLGTAVQFDMVFNTYYAWSNADASVSDKMDVLNIAAHESGHMMGLNHGPTPELTMYAYADFGEIIKRDLADGDIAGINARYP